MEADDTRNGGPAFPGGHGTITGPTCGMSLRDYFAGQALAGRMARGSTYKTWADAATDAYEAADAMLAERAKAK